MEDERSDKEESTAVYPSDQDILVLEASIFHSPITRSIDQSRSSYHGERPFIAYVV